MELIQVKQHILDSGHRYTGWGYFRGLLLSHMLVGRSTIRIFMPTEIFTMEL